MTHYQLVSQNKIKSWGIVLGFIIFVVAATYFMVEGFGYGLDLVGWALIFSGVISLDVISPFFNS